MSVGISRFGRQVNGLIVDVLCGFFASGLTGQYPADNAFCWRITCGWTGQSTGDKTYLYLLVDLITNQSQVVQFGQRLGTIGRNDAP